MHAPRKLLAATALAVAGLALSGAPASAAPPPPPDTEPFCRNVPSGFGGFPDIGSTNNQRNIQCLAGAEVTTGDASGNYNPTGTVTRAQMATFIARMIDKVNELSTGNPASRPLPASGPNAFQDDNGLVPHEANINRLVAAGVVAGFPDGTFKPGNPVTRAQMATFINNAQAFLFNGIRLTSTEDFFGDDNGLQPHEPNINGIAGAGIAQGVNGTNYVPGDGVSRNQMASFIVRYFAVLHAAGAIDELPPIEDIIGNATLDITPLDAVTRIDADADAGTDNDADDERTYTVSDLDPNEDYRVTLVNCDNIGEDEGANFSFEEDADTGLAAATPNDFAGIVEINEVDAGRAQTVGAIVPVNRQITFTVDAEEFGCVRPVVYVDAGDNTRLELDENGEPVEDFGVGGEFNSMPAELADGAAFDGTILAVLRDENIVVIDETPDEAGTGQSFITYDAGDSYFLVSNDPNAEAPCPNFPPNFCTASDLDDFEQLAGRGDGLAGTYDENGDSDLILDDVVLGGPQITAVDASVTTAVVTLEGVDDEATRVDIFVDAGDLTGDFEQADLVGTATEDQDPDTAGFQVNISGLNEGTDYTAFAVQTVNDEESEPSEGFAFSTPLDLEQPAITAVEADFDSAVFTVDVDPDADAVKIYLVEGTLVGDFDDAALAATATEDADPDVDGFQVEVTGLTPDEQYSAFATQTVDTTESGESARTSFTTDVEPAEVTLESAVQNEVNNGQGSTDEVIATYAADVDCGDTVDAELVAEDSTVIDVIGCAEGTASDQVVFTLETAINDGQGIPVTSPEVEYTLNVAEGTVQTAPGGVPVVAGSSSFTY